MKNIKSVSGFLKNVVDVVSVVDSCFTLADIFIKPEPAPDYRLEYEDIVSLYFEEEEDNEGEEDSIEYDGNDIVTVEDLEEAAKKPKICPPIEGVDKYERGREYLKDISSKYLENPYCFIGEGEEYDTKWEQDNKINAQIMEESWREIINTFNKKVEREGDKLKGIFTIPAIDYELRKIKEGLAIKYSFSRTLSLYKFAEEVKDFELSFNVIVAGEKLKQTKNKNLLRKLKRKVVKDNAVSDSTDCEEATN